VTLLHVRKEKIMSKLSVYFLFLFLSAGAVFAQQVHSEAEVKQACTNNLKLSALTSNCHQNIDLTKNKKVQKTCAQDIQYCSDKIICFLATVKRHGKRFWATSGNGSKYLKEASRRDLACGKLPPKLQEPPLSSDAPQSNSVTSKPQEDLNTPNLEAATPKTASGPPLTSGEKMVIMRLLSKCWTPDSGSLSANISVTLRWQMSPSGKLVAGSIKMTDSEGADSDGLKRALQIAKGAVLRCANKMRAILPPEKYNQWREIEVRFDPSDMKSRYE
jgi:hypothetical protein